MGLSKILLVIQTGQGVETHSEILRFNRDQAEGVPVRSHGTQAKPAEMLQVLTDDTSIHETTRVGRNGVRGRSTHVAQRGGRVICDAPTRIGDRALPQGPTGLAEGRVGPHQEDRLSGLDVVQL